MLALSLLRPWGSLIVSGAKTVENRHWQPPAFIVGSHIVIHSASGIDERAAAQYDDAGPTGFLGVVRVVRVCTDATAGRHCDCNQRWAIPGYRHWRLADARAFPAPMPGRGRYGLWSAPERVAVVAQRVIGAR